MSIDVRDDATAQALVGVVSRIPDVAAAFLGGSLVEGYGNSTSDIDLLVLVSGNSSSVELELQDREHLLVVDDSAVLVSWVGNTRVDVEIRGIDDFTVRVDLLKTDDASLFLRPEFSQGWLEFLNDLKIGIAVGGVDFGLESVRKNLDWGQLSTLLARKYEYFANASIDDVVGAIDASDGGAAELSSRAALEFGIDSWLARRGETNPKPKWRFAKLAKLKGSERVTSEYWKLLGTHGADPESDALSRAEQRVLFTQGLIFSDLDHEG